MRIMCPSCEKQSVLPPNYAGLVHCPCGTRFDGFAHPVKVVQKPASGKALVVMPSNLPSVIQIGLPIDWQMKIPAPKNLLMQTMTIFGAAAIVIGAGYAGAHLPGSGSSSVGTMAAAPGNSIAKPKIMEQAKNDPDKVSLSEIEFKEMGKGSYFVRAVMANKGATTFDWPMLEVTFIAGGQDIAQELYSPLEYLAGEIASGRTPTPSLAPGQETPVWTHITLPQDSIAADSYRVRALYKQH